MTRLQLKRPLVFFDLETTGVDPARDRIVELCILRVEPDGSRQSRTRRINPGRPIPPEATAVHGITDDDVRDEPRFDQVARGLLELLDGADLAGFNIVRFDVPMLDAELQRCKLDLDLASRRVVDSMAIFHKMEPRNLTAAVRLYLDRDHDGAHGAEADVLASAEVLEAQLARYDELPADIEALDAWSRGGPGAVDLNGKFVWREGEVVVNFGKHQGTPLRQLVDRSPDYLKWFLGKDFPSDAKKLVESALRGQFPEPPQSA